MELFKFNFAAATDYHLVEIACGYIRYYENSTGGGLDPRIKVQGLNGGWSAELLPGEWMKTPAQDRGFIVTNQSGVTITGKLMVAADAGAVGSDRISGNVSVIDTNRIKVLSDTIFQTAQYVGVVAAQYPHLAVYNKASSAKNLAVQILNMTSGTTMQMDFARNNAVAWTLGNTPENKRLGYAVTANHELYKTNNAVPQGTQTYLGGTTLAAGVQRDIPRGDPPIVLLPNQSLILRGLTVATDLTATFLVEEF